VRSPHRRARIVSIDAAAARALPGVVAVVVGDEPDLAAERLLGGDTRFVGDRVAVVVAEDRELAERAAEAIVVEYEVLIPVLELEAGKEVGRKSHQAGAAVPRAAKGDQAIEATWRWPIQDASVVEPPTTVAYTDEDGRLVVRAGTEAPFALRRFVAQRLGLPSSGLRVARPQVGAPFGAAEGPRDADLCAAVARLVGRPVRLTERNVFPPAPDRAAHAVGLRAVVRAGRLQGLDLRITINLGSSPHQAEDALTAALEAAAGFACPNLSVEARAVMTDLPPLRVPGRHAARAVRFALEGLVDEIGRTGGGDPLEARLRLAGPEDAAAIREGAAAAGWAERRRAPSVAVARHGRGVAAAAPRPAAATAAAFAANADGSLTLRLSASGAPAGIGPVVLGQAARALGVGADRIALVATDTDSAPAEDFGPAEAYLVARAVKAAAEQLRSRLEAKADGVVAASGVATPSPDDRRSAAVFAEVEVDGETGIVRVLRLLLSAGWAPGSPLRPLEDGAVMGGAALALGAADRASDVPAPERIVPSATDDELPPLPDLFAAGAAAVAHAVADAVSAPVLALPIRPERVLEALDSVRGESAGKDAP
jgi:CO/xanthine dehydrogenase Mo-binding subunit